MGKNVRKLLHLNGKRLGETMTSFPAGSGWSCCWRAGEDRAQPAQRTPSPKACPQALLLLEEKWLPSPLCSTKCTWMHLHVRAKWYPDPWWQRGLKTYYSLLATAIDTLRCHGLEMGSKNQQKLTTQSLPSLFSLHALFLLIFNFINNTNKSLIMILP